MLYGEERTNYPVGLSVDDLGNAIGLTAQVNAEIDPRRVCELMQRALEGMVRALREGSQQALWIGGCAAWGGA